MQPVIEQLIQERDRIEAAIRELSQLAEKTEPKRKGGKKRPGADATPDKVA